MAVFYIKLIIDLKTSFVTKVLVDVDSEEFILFIRLLASMPSMSTLTGRQELVNIIMAQSEIDKPFDDVNYFILNCQNVSYNLKLKKL